MANKKNKIDTPQEMDACRVAGATVHEPKTVQAAMRREGIKISAKEIKALVREHGHRRERLYSLIRIQNAAKGLLYMSEGDHPIELATGLEFSLAELMQPEATTLDQFFEGQNLVPVKEALQKELKDIKIYRDGEVEVKIYIIGTLPDGHYAGVKTKSIET